MRRRRSWPVSASVMIRWRGDSSRRMKRPSAVSWKLWTHPLLTPRWVRGTVPGRGPLTRAMAMAMEAASGGAGGGRRGGAGHPAFQPRRAGRAPAGRHRPAGLRRARSGRRGRKTNEITQFAPLLEDLDIAGAVITADALHTQREHATFLVSDKKAHYILVVKKNQPTLYAQVKNLPWRNIPACCQQRDRGHGREEHRTLNAAAVTTGLAFPHAAQAAAAQLAGWIRDHWQIEILHHIRSPGASLAVASCGAGATRVPFSC
jgi:predicted transposase YbfD/YdcC